MTLAVIIVTWNSERVIGACLQSLAAASDEYEVWVVDNNSADATVAIVENEFPRVRLIQNTDNLGFAKANNQAIDKSEASMFLILNPDTVVMPDTISIALKTFEELPDVGMLGVKLLNRDGSLQPSCFRFPGFFVNLAEQLALYRIFDRGRRGRVFLSAFWEHDHKRPVDWIMGAFMLVSRATVEKAGKIPEEYFMYGEDMDWCFRIWQNGMKVWFTPDAGIMHIGNDSGNQMPSEWGVQKRCESKYSFCRRSYGAIVTKFIEFTDMCGHSLRLAFYKLKGSRDETVPMIVDRLKISQRAAVTSLFR
ncbi:MAG TPA: glycosyltransferase family 2 protein [Pyrinomonadaceae bacterium]|jgi:hypothetical protein|nr:glycosyltransferase family 2 protein [Pyrinomonadaceae bacterium]